MNKYDSTFNVPESGQVKTQNFSFPSVNNLEEGNTTPGKISFKYLPATQHSLENTEAHYRSGLLTQGSIFRQPEQIEVYEESIANKGSIVDNIEGKFMKNRQNYAQTTNKQQNYGLFIAESHVLDHKTAYQQRKLERYAWVGDNKTILKNSYYRNQSRNNVVFSQPSQVNYVQPSNLTTNRTEQNQWIETTIQRPKYTKRYDNKAQLFRTLAPDQDPKMKKRAICAPWLWGLLGFLGLVAAVLGVIFGLGLLPGRGFRFGGPSIISPTVPETNVTTPQVLPEPAEVNWVDPVPIDKIPVYRTTPLPGRQYNKIVPVTSPSLTGQTGADQFIDPQPIAMIPSVVQILPVTEVTRTEHFRTTTREHAAESHLTSPSPLV